MPRRRQSPRKLKRVVGDASDPQGMVALADAFLGALRVNNYTEQTIEGRRRYIGYFIAWCENRGVTRPNEVTRPVLERYRRWLYHHRKRDGGPMSFHGQRARLALVRAFFRWLARQNLILYNPASELEMPRLEKRLPRDVLTADEAERIINIPDTDTPVGMRDRAILETLYSTGIRRMELVNLALYDLDQLRRTLMVRLGKGHKDRFVPIGERAVLWVDKYLHESRPAFVMEPDGGALFITDRGDPFTNAHLTRMVRQYIDAAGVTKRGSCHIWRHTMATLMLENGCDIRFIQAMLGHSKLSTTAIYTQVSIRKLQEMHAATHPAGLRPAPSSVEAEMPDGEKTDTGMHGTEDTRDDADADADGTVIRDDDSTVDGHAVDAIAEPTADDILDVLDAEADEECGTMRPTGGDG